MQAIGAVAITCRNVGEGLDGRLMIAGCDHEFATLFRGDLGKQYQRALGMGFQSSCLLDKDPAFWRGGETDSGEPCASSCAGSVILRGIWRMLLTTVNTHGGTTGTLTGVTSSLLLKELLRATGGHGAVLL